MAQKGRGFGCGMVAGMMIWLVVALVVLSGIGGLHVETLQAMAGTATWPVVRQSLTFLSNWHERLEDKPAQEYLTTCMRTIWLLQDAHHQQIVRRYWELLGIPMQLPILSP